MEEELLAGIADAYWFEWYVGLEKVLDLLNPDAGVVGVTLQASRQQGLDDVVVRYKDGRLECIQVKHTRKDTKLTYTYLFCRNTKNGKKRPSLIKEYSDDWKKVRESYEECIPIIYTNRKIGTAKYNPPKGNGYKRPPLKDFWEALKSELTIAQDISDVQFSDMLNHPKETEKEKGKVYKVAFDNILQEMSSLTDEEKLIFLKEFHIFSDEKKDLDVIKKCVDEKLAKTLNIDERKCEKFHNSLLKGLSRWTVSTRKEEEITKEQVLEVLGLEQDELVGEHNFATEEPFFKSRIQWIENLKCEILENNCGVFLYQVSQAQEKLILSVIWQMKKIALLLRDFTLLSQYR